MEDAARSGRALRRLLDAHAPQGPREAAALDRFRDLLDGLDRPCDRAAGPVHVTASAFVVGERGTVLLLHRRLEKWLQPGGHIEDGELPAAAALREAEEETGMTLAHPGAGPVLVHVDVHDAALGHTHLDLRYLLVAGPEDPAPPPDESQHVRWYSWEEAEHVADAGLVEGLRAARVASSAAGVHTSFEREGAR